jgi:hypothetical protein
MFHIWLTSAVAPEAAHGLTAASTFSAAARFHLSQHHALDRKAVYLRTGIDTLRRRAQRGMLHLQLTSVFDLRAALVLTAAALSFS